MKIFSTVVEIMEHASRKGELVFKEIDSFDTREEAINKIQELVRKNKNSEQPPTYTIIDEFTF